MKKLFGEYLKVKRTDGADIYYWYRINALIIILFSLSLLLMAFGIAEWMGLESMGEMKVIKFTPVARGVYWTVSGLMFIVVLFNRRSTLEIRGEVVRFKKWSLFGTYHTFDRNQISYVFVNKQWDVGESDAGRNREIYNFSVSLKNGKKIRIGSFNGEDCERLKRALGHPGLK